MAAPPTKEALLSLYSSMLRTSRSFSSYNFRQYFEHRTKDTFRTIQVSRLLLYRTRLLSDERDVFLFVTLIF